MTRSARSLHELKTRKAGLSTFIQVHIELDPEMKLAQAHAVSDAVERALCAEFPGAEVIIHQDPAGLERVPPLSASDNLTAEPSRGAGAAPPDPPPAP